MLAFQCVSYYGPNLVEGVGTGSPPGQEQTQADRLEDPANRTNCHRVQGSLLREDLAHNLHSRVSFESSGYFTRDRENIHRERS